MAALRSSDMSSYVALLQQTKNSRLQQVLAQTDSCLAQIAAKLGDVTQAKAVPAGGDPADECMLLGPAPQKFTTAPAFGQQFLLKRAFEKTLMCVYSNSTVRQVRVPPSGGIAAFVTKGVSAMVRYNSVICMLCGSCRGWCWQQQGRAVHLGCPGLHAAC